MFSISATASKKWLFCGESLDDMRAWQLALEQARLIIIRPPNLSHHGGRYHHHISNNPTAQYNHITPSHMQQMLSSHYATHLYNTSQRIPYYVPAFSDGSHRTFVPSPSSNTAGGAHNPQGAPYSSLLPPPPPSMTPFSSQAQANGRNLQPDFHHPIATRPPQMTAAAGAPNTVDSAAASINGQLRPDGRDVAMGMLAGAAVGSMMWSPSSYFWW